MPRFFRQDKKNEVLIHECSKCGNISWKNLPKCISVCVCVCLFQFLNDCRKINLDNTLVSSSSIMKNINNNPPQISNKKIYSLTNILIKPIVQQKFITITVRLFLLHCKTISRKWPHWDSMVLCNRVSYIFLVS